MLVNTHTQNKTRDFFFVMVIPITWRMARRTSSAAPCAMSGRDDWRISAAPSA